MDLSMDSVEFFELRDKVIELLQREAEALQLAASLIARGNLSRPPWLCELLETADRCRAERAALFAKLRDVDPFARNAGTPLREGGL
jgi:hypothetical protein